VPKLGYALFPPNFVKDLLQSYGPNKELTAFKADRDYFSIEVGNPSEHIRENFAEMSYKSSNVQEDFVILVEKKPVGPLLLTSTDFKITYHSSKVRTCRIRIEINGRLGQVGKGDTEIFQEVRERESSEVSNNPNRENFVEHANGSNRGHKRCKVSNRDSVKRDNSTVSTHHHKVEQTD
jgi:hypothetical protein